MTNRHEEDERVIEILAAARRRPVAEREAYLRSACAGDESLRHKVMGGLAGEERRDGVLQQPVAVISSEIPLDATVTLAAQFAGGLKIGQYRIESKLGEGGMSTVWLAFDTRLGRPVAIKFLANNLDAEARRRFQRETEMASSLNHPHIVTVYDIDEFEGRHYLVTEYVDGGTLRDWVKKQQRTAKDVVELLTGVADGLAAAHQAGILHRDIKPLNILVARNGYAKLADFGLAKLAESGASDLATNSPEGATRPGFILGTIAYMSPEQASGQPLDARSDIFSFGVVLYEMLSNKRPFGGRTDLEVLQAIIHGDMAPLSEEVPEVYRAVVAKALKKNPAERYQSMREMVEDLRRGQRLLPSPPHQSANVAELPKPAGRERVSWRPLPLALVAIGLVMVGAAFLLRPLVTRYQERRTAVPSVTVEQRITANPPDAPVTAVSVSPDGKYIAYSDVTGLYLREIASGETRLWGVPKNFIAYPNNWFPDGTHLLVTRVEGAFRKPSLWKLSILGSPPRLLMENAASGSVSPDGLRIAYVPGTRVPEAVHKLLLGGHDVGSELWLMDAEGTNPRKIAAAENATDAVFNSRIWKVIWSPHGQRIAYIEEHGFALSDPAGGRYSLRTREANGDGLQVTLRDARLRPTLCWIPDGRILYAYSEDPASERDDQGIRSIDVDERTGKATGQPRSVTRGSGRIGGLSATSDGKQLVLLRSNTEPQAFLSKFDAGTRRLTSLRRLTLDANGNLAEAWTPDSKSVLFVSNRSGTWKLFKQAIDETTAEVLVEGRSLFLPRLSPDGSQILYMAYAKPDSPSRAIDLMRVPLAGGAPQLVLQATGITNHQCASLPSQLCLVSKQAGTENIFHSFSAERGEGQVLTKTDHITNWSLSPDGSKLAIFINDHQLRFFAVNTGLFHDVDVNGWQLENGDWASDGKSVLAQSITATGAPVILDVDEAGNAKVIFEGAPNMAFKWVVPSPDGHFAILEADVPGDDNVWIAENF